MISKYDKSHIATEKALTEIERKLRKIYSRAQKEVIEKARKFFLEFKVLDDEKRKKLKSGEITEADYNNWRTTKVLQNRHWQALRQQLAAEYTKINQAAIAYVNEEILDIYLLNYNSAGKEIASKVKGYSFEMIDKSAVESVAKSNKTLLPYKKINGKKDERWNTKKINAEILQGILQGESIGDIAERLQKVTEMTRESAIRNARTAVTSAESKGRQDSFERAKENGVISKKVWLAARDARTRATHRALDGQEVEIDQPFEIDGYKIMYPGDPDAAPEMTYNCRCTMKEKIIGFVPKKAGDDEK